MSIENEIPKAKMTLDRSEFEDFVRRYWGSHGYAFPTDKAGDYVHADVMGMWRAWCAALIAHGSRRNPSAAPTDEIERLRAQLLVAIRSTGSREDDIRLLAWAYRKLMPYSFSKQEDALAMDEIKLMLDGAF